MRAVLFAIFVCTLGITVRIAVAESPPRNDSAAVKPQMHAAYAAFRDLQKYIVSRSRFSDPANDAEIRTLLRQLRSSFHTVENKEFPLADEPGFASTLKVTNELLDDALHRFEEGKKEYTLWRLKSASNFCVSCHTRHEVPMQFSDEDVQLKGLSVLEQGEFFLATRQLDRAKNAFEAAVLDPQSDATRMDALRSWLLVYTRAKPDPSAALTELTKLVSRVSFRPYDQEEVQSWIVSLRRWKSENKAAKVPVLVKAENLIRQGIGVSDVLSPRSGTVELLRATALLHTELEKPQAFTHTERAHALYLLGLAYSELPFFFVAELPEMFLEQSIRELPNSDTAKNAFRKYREVVTQSFTGSGGTRIPDDVLLKFRELHDLAFGALPQKDQV